VESVPTPVIYCILSIRSVECDDAIDVETPLLMFQMLQRLDKNFFDMLVVQRVENRLARFPAFDNP
jgi:hypothetical protein